MTDSRRVTWTSFAVLAMFLLVAVVSLMVVVDLWFSVAVTAFPLVTVVVEANVQALVVVFTVAELVLVAVLLPVLEFPK